MINIVIVSGIVALGLTILVLGVRLVIIKIKRYKAKKRYQKLIRQKMSILAQLQEELKDRGISEQEYTPNSPTPELPPQEPLPAQFFETNYVEVKV